MTRLKISISGKQTLSCQAMYSSAAASKHLCQTFRVTTNSTIREAQAPHHRKTALLCHSFLRTNQCLLRNRVLNCSKQNLNRGSISHHRWRLGLSILRHRISAGVNRSTPLSSSLSSKKRSILLRSPESQTHGLGSKSRSLARTAVWKTSARNQDRNRPRIKS